MHVLHDPLALLRLHLQPLALAQPLVVALEQLLALAHAGFELGARGLGFTEDADEAVDQRRGQCHQQQRPGPVHPQRGAGEQDFRGQQPVVHGGAERDQHGGQQQRMRAGRCCARCISA